MPSWSAVAPWGLPVVIAVFWFSGFPENEVGNGIFLVFVGIRALVLGFAEVELSLVESGEFAVFGE